jgi:drug/metabolite transporter (DMT)-like permease
VNLRGLLHLLTAAVLFSMMSALVKVAGETLPSSMMVFARAVVTLAMSAVWVKSRGLSFLGVNRPLLLLRGVLGFIGLLTYFFAITRLPLAEVVVIHHVNPIVTAGFAAFFLMEPVRLSFVIAVLLSLTGLVLVAGPSFFVVGGPSLDPLGLAAVITGVFSSAGAYVCVRKLRKTDDPLVTVFYFSLVAVPGSLPFVIPTFVMPQGHEWALLLGIGVVTQLAQVELTRGLSLVEAGPATTIGTINIVIGAVIGVLFFGEEAHVTSMIGAALVILGTITVAFGDRFLLRVRERLSR